MKILSTLILILVGFMWQAHAQTADVIKATGATNISIDLYNEADPSNPLGYVPITGPSIRETAGGQLIAGETMQITLPSGYKWNTAATPSITITPTGTINTKLVASITSFTAQTLTITINAQSEAKGAGLGPGRIDMFGLEVGPTAGIAPDNQIITNTGTTGPTGISYGTLSKRAGAIDQILVETLASGNGQVLQAQSLLVGNNITAYAIGRDKMGNYIDNVALQSTSDWSLINSSGGITQTALEPALDLKSATFGSQLSGSAQIQADSAGLSTVTPSGVITFNPRPASQMVIIQQPPASAVANQTHSQATIIQLRDQFGNVVTSNSQTSASISISNGDGTLSGTLTKQAVNGVITFDDLSSQVANNIQLTVQSSGLPSVTTSSIAVDHNIATSLKYLVQPSNTAQNKTIIPAVELQVIDAYGNDVDSVLTVTISGSHFTSTSDSSNSTNSSGKVTFNLLTLTATATLGLTTISASFPGISANVVSNNFEIISAGALAKFVVQTTGEFSIGSQTAGVPFDIRIRALDGSDNVFVQFTDTVQLTSNSQLYKDGLPVDSIVTAPFVNGVLDLSVTLTTAGLSQLFVENTAVSRNGTSNQFNVIPTVYSAANSIIESDKNELIANGSNTAIITAKLRDVYGNFLNAGGETVNFSTNKGTFSGGTSITASDQANGTYTANLTSSTNASDTAFVTGTVNAEAIADTAVVDFIPGNIAAFSINTPGIQEAGVPFTIDISANDLLGNNVPSYNGTVTISANNSVISSGSSVSFTNGQAIGHSITLTKSGSNISLTASADDLFNIQGSSSNFTVTPSAPSPITSRITVSPKVLQNNPAYSSTITLTLRDAFNNKLLSEESTAITASQILLDGNPSSGIPGASVSGITYNSNSSTYTATVNPSQSIETIEFTGYIGTSVDGTPINTKDTLAIVLPNEWTAGASGPTSVKTNWTNGDNWLSGVPNSGDIVVIPNVANLPILNLNISLGSLQIDPGASLMLLEGNQMDITGNLQIDGILDLDKNTSLSVDGNLSGSGTFTASDSVSIVVKGNLSLPNLFTQTLGTSLTLNGTEEQLISVPTFFTRTLNVQNHAIVENGVSFFDIGTLNISEGHTFELQAGGNDTLDINTAINGTGTLLLNDDVLALAGDLNVSNIDASQASLIFGVRENLSDYSALSLQEIFNVSSAQNITVNNSFGVRTYDDLTINGTLNLVNGPLIIASGKSLIASTITKSLGTIRMQRLINSTSGWRMLSAPLDTTFADFFDKTVTQGFPNSTLGNAAVDSLLPNVLWYDAAYTESDATGSDGVTPRDATDNERWRAPADANDYITAGRGYFVYFFGNVATDDRYNIPLPLTLDIEGQEQATTSGTFTFPEIAYNEVSDGWNLVGNPFTASISWDNAGWTKTNVDNVVYAWDPVTNDYFYWNGIGGGSLDGTVLSNGIIRPMQAFWVKANATGASLSLNTSAKTTGGSFLGKYQKNPESIGLSLSGNGMMKSTYVTFSADGKTSKDVRDAFRLLPFETNSYLEFYSSLQDGTELALNNFARDFGTEIEIPLHVGAYEDGFPLNGSFEIGLHNVDELPAAWSITLLDTETDKEINLRDEVSYTFNLTQDPQKRAKVNTIKNFTLRNTSTKAKSSQATNARFRLIVSPGEDADGLPDTFELFNNYPNPFNPATTLEFSVPLEGPVSLEIYDILGRKVSTVVKSNFVAGYHRVRWDASGYSSGLYLAVFRAGGTETVKKLTLIK